MTKAHKQERILYVGGRKPALEVFRFAQERIIEVFISEDAARRGFPEPLQNNILTFRGSVTKLPLEDLEKFRVGNHQGVVIKIYAKKEISVQELVQRAKDEPNRVLLVLDQVSDPQNLGSIFRVADAFHIAGIILTERRSSSVTPAVVSVSRGASELLDVATVGNLQRTLEFFRKEGVWIVGAAIGPGTECIEQFEFSFPLAIVCGAEGRGLRELTKRQCDWLVEISLSGHMQSLNVSQAVSIFLYESRKQATGISPIES